MSISYFSIKQNLIDLNADKEKLPEETQDAISRVTDDMMDILESIKNFKADFIE